MLVALIYSTATRVLLRTVIPDPGYTPAVRPGESLTMIDNAALPKNQLGATNHAFDFTIPAALAQKGIVILPPTRLAVFDAAAGTPIARPFVDSVMADIALYKPAGMITILHPDASVGWTFNRLATNLQPPTIKGQAAPAPIAVAPSSVSMPTNGSVVVA